MQSPFGEASEVEQEGLAVAFVDSGDGESEEGGGLFEGSGVLGWHGSRSGWHTATALLNRFEEVAAVLAYVKAWWAPELRAVQARISNDNP